MELPRNWDLFDIPELERAPKYEFYSSDESLERVLSLSKKYRTYSTSYIREKD